MISGYFDNIHKDGDKIVILHVPEYQTVVQSRKSFFTVPHSHKFYRSCIFASQGDIHFVDHKIHRVIVALAREDVDPEVEGILKPSLEKCFGQCF